MLGWLDGSHLQPLGQLAVSSDGQLADWVLDAPRIAVGAPTSFELTAMAVSTTTSDTVRLRVRGTLHGQSGLSAASGYNRRSATRQTGAPGARIGPIEGGPPHVLLEGKKLLITGVLTDDSMAFAASQVAQEAGAEILLTSVGRAMSLTQRVAKKLDPVPDVFDMDVNDDMQIAGVRAEVEKRWGKLDGVLHSIGFMPQSGLGGRFLETPWEDVATGFRTSAFSLKSLSTGMLEPMKKAGSASVVSLTFDGRFAWPIYDWMGVAKAGLEATTRYLARDLGPHGVRVNTVSAGPIRTMAGKNIPGFDEIAGGWLRRSPLKWSLTDATPVGQMVAFLLSDWSAMTTGEMIHVDGGYHAMGTDITWER